MEEDDIRLRQEGDRIEGLLDEVASMAGPQTWQRVEELLRRTVSLYGEGLRRVLAHAHDCGHLDVRLQDRLRRDELVSSLLLLHGLHPEPTADRVREALDGVRPYLAEHGGGVDLLGIADGVVRLRLRGSCDGCGASGVTLEHTIERAIHEAAPEVSHVQVEAGELIALGRGRSSER